MNNNNKNKTDIPMSYKDVSANILRACLLKHRGFKNYQIKEMLGLSSTTITKYIRIGKEQGLFKPLADSDINTTAEIISKAAWQNIADAIICDKDLDLSVRIVQDQHNRLIPPALRSEVSYQPDFSKLIEQFTQLKQLKDSLAGKDSAIDADYSIQDDADAPPTGDSQSDDGTMGGEVND